MADQVAELVEQRPRHAPLTLLLPDDEMDVRPSDEVQEAETAPAVLGVAFEQWIGSTYGTVDFDAGYAAHLREVIAYRAILDL